MYTALSGLLSSTSRTDYRVKGNSITSILALNITLREELPFVFFLDKEKISKRNKGSTDEVFTAKNKSPKV